MCFVGWHAASEGSWRLVGVCITQLMMVVFVSEFYVLTLTGFFFRRRLVTLGDV